MGNIHIGSNLPHSDKWKNVDASRFVYDSYINSFNSYQTLGSDELGHRTHGFDTYSSEKVIRQLDCTTKELLHMNRQVRFLRRAQAACIDRYPRQEPLEKICHPIPMSLIDESTQSFGFTDEVLDAAFPKKDDRKLFSKTLSEIDDLPADTPYSSWYEGGVSDTTAEAFLCLGELVAKLLTSSSGSKVSSEFLGSCSRLLRALHSALLSKSGNVEDISAVAQKAMTQVAIALLAVAAKRESLSDGIACFSQFRVLDQLSTAGSPISVQVVPILQSMTACRVPAKGGKLALWFGNSNKYKHGTAFSATSAQPPYYHFEKGNLVSASLSTRIALGVDEQGVAYMWGNKNRRRKNRGPRRKLGAGVADEWVPQKISSLDGIPIADVSAGSNFSLVLTKSGQVWGMGSNSNHQLPVPQGFSPTQFERMDCPEFKSGVTCLTASYGECSFYATADKKVYACGNNSDGQLGIGVSGGVRSLTEVPSLRGEEIIQLCSGVVASFALTKSGKLYGWGIYNGNNSRVVTTPTLISALKDKKVIRVSSGREHAAAVTADGAVYTWGTNDYGQLGAQFGGYNCAPATIPSAPSNKVIWVDCGAMSTAVILDNGQIYCSGEASQARSRTYDFQPVAAGLPVFSSKSFQKVYVGQGAYMAIEGSVDSADSEGTTVVEIENDDSKCSRFDVGGLLTNQILSELLPEDQWLGKTESEKAEEAEAKKAAEGDSSSKGGFSGFVQVVSKKLRGKSRSRSPKKGKEKKLVLTADQLSLSALSRQVALSPRAVMLLLLSLLDKAADTSLVNCLARVPRTFEVHNFEADERDVVREGRAVEISIQALSSLFNLAKELKASMNLDSSLDDNDGKDNRWIDATSLVAVLRLLRINLAWLLSSSFDFSSIGVDMSRSLENSNKWHQDDRDEKEVKEVKSVIQEKFDIKQVGSFLTQLYLDTVSVVGSDSSSDSKESALHFLKEASGQAYQTCLVALYPTTADKQDFILQILESGEGICSDPSMRQYLLGPDGFGNAAILSSFVPLFRTNDITPDRIAEKEMLKKKEEKKEGKEESPTDDAAAEVGWNCPQCTFLNKPMSTECPMCGAPCPADYVPPKSAGAKSPQKNKKEYEVTPAHEVAALDLLRKRAEMVHNRVEHFFTFVDKAIDAHFKQVEEVTSSSTCDEQTQKGMKWNGFFLAKLQQYTLAYLFDGMEMLPEIKRLSPDKLEHLRPKDVSRDYWANSQRVRKEFFIEAGKRGDTYLIQYAEKLFTGCQAIVEILSGQQARWSQDGYAKYIGNTSVATLLPALCLMIANVYDSRFLNRHMIFQFLENNWDKIFSILSNIDPMIVASKATEQIFLEGQGQACAKAVEECVREKEEAHVIYKAFKKDYEEVIKIDYVNQRKLLKDELKQQKKDYIARGEDVPVHLQGLDDEDNDDDDEELTDLEISAIITATNNAIQSNNPSNNTFGGLPKRGLYNTNSFNAGWNPSSVPVTIDSEYDAFMTEISANQFAEAAISRKTVKAAVLSKRSSKAAVLNNNITPRAVQNSLSNIPTPPELTDALKRNRELNTELIKLLRKVEASCFEKYNERSWSWMVGLQRQLLKLASCLLITEIGGNKPKPPTETENKDGKEEKGEKDSKQSDANQIKEQKRALTEEEREQKIERDQKERTWLASDLLKVGFNGGEYDGFSVLNDDDDVPQPLALSRRLTPMARSAVITSEDVVQFIHGCIKNTGLGGQFCDWMVKKLHRGPVRSKPEIDEAARAVWVATLKHHGLMAEAISQARLLISKADDMPKSYKPTATLVAVWKESYHALQMHMSARRNKFKQTGISDAEATNKASEPIMKAATFLLRVSPSIETVNGHGFNPTEDGSEDGDDGKKSARTNARRNWAKIRSVVEAVKIFRFMTVKSLMNEFEQKHLSRSCFNEIRNFLAQADELDLESLAGRMRKNRERALLREQGLKRTYSMLELCQSSSGYATLLSFLRSSFDKNVLDTIQGAGHDAQKAVQKAFGSLVNQAMLVLDNEDVDINTRAQSLTLLLAKIHPRADEHSLLTRVNVFPVMQKLLAYKPQPKPEKEKDSSDKKTADGKEQKGDDNIEERVSTICEAAGKKLQQIVLPQVKKSALLNPLGDVFAILVSQLARGIKHAGYTTHTRYKPSPQLHEAANVLFSQVDTALCVVESGDKHNLDNALQVLRSSLKLVHRIVIEVGDKEIAQPKWMQAFRRILSQPVTYNISQSPLQILRQLFNTMGPGEAQALFWTSNDPAEQSSFIGFFMDLIAGGITSSNEDDEKTYAETDGGDGEGDEAVHSFLKLQENSAASQQSRINSVVALFCHLLKPPEEPTQDVDDILFGMDDEDEKEDGESKEYVDSKAWTAVLIQYLNKTMEPLAGLFQDLSQLEQDTPAVADDADGKKGASATKASHCLPSSIISQLGQVQAGLLILGQRQLSSTLFTDLCRESLLPLLESIVMPAYSKVLVSIQEAESKWQSEEEAEAKKKMEKGTAESDNDDDDDDTDSKDEKDAKTSNKKEEGSGPEENANAPQEVTILPEPSLAQVSKMSLIAGILKVISRQSIEPDIIKNLVKTHQLASLCALGSIPVTIYDDGLINIRKKESSLQSTISHISTKRKQVWTDFCDEETAKNRSKGETNKDDESKSTGRKEEKSKKKTSTKTKAPKKELCPSGGRDLEPIILHACRGPKLQPRAESSAPFTRSAKSLNLLNYRDCINVTAWEPYEVNNFGVRSFPLNDANDNLFAGDTGSSLGNDGPPRSHLANLLLFDWSLAILHARQAVLNIMNEWSKHEEGDVPASEAASDLTSTPFTLETFGPSKPFLRFFNLSLFRHDYAEKSNNNHRRRRRHNPYDDAAHFRNLDRGDYGRGKKAPVRDGNPVKPFTPAKADVLSLTSFQQLLANELELGNASLFESILEDSLRTFEAASSNEHDHTLWGSRSIHIEVDEQAGFVSSGQTLSASLIKQAAERIHDLEEERALLFNGPPATSVTQLIETMSGEANNTSPSTLTRQYSGGGRRGGRGGRAKRGGRTSSKYGGGFNSYYGQDELSFGGGQLFNDTASAIPTTDKKKPMKKTPDDGKIRFRMPTNIPDVQALVSPNLERADWLLHTLMEAGYAGMTSKDTFTRLVQCTNSPNLVLKERILRLLSLIIESAEKWDAEHADQPDFDDADDTQERPSVADFLVLIPPIRRFMLEEFGRRRMAQESRDKHRALSSPLLTALLDFLATLDRATDAFKRRGLTDKLFPPVLRCAKNEMKGFTMAWSSTRPGNAANPADYEFVLELADFHGDPPVVEVKEEKDEKKSTKKGKKPDIRLNVGGSINIRADAGLDFESLGKMQPLQIITVLETKTVTGSSGGKQTWIRHRQGWTIERGANDGRILLLKVDPSKNQYVNVAGRDVNIRVDADISSPDIGTKLLENEIIVVEEEKEVMSRRGLPQVWCRHARGWTIRESATQGTPILHSVRPPVQKVIDWSGITFNEVYRGPSLIWVSPNVIPCSKHHFRVKMVNSKDPEHESEWSKAVSVKPERVLEKTTWDEMLCMWMQIDLKNNGLEAFLPNDPPYTVTLLGKTSWSMGVHSWKIRIVGMQGAMYLGVAGSEYEKVQPLGACPQGYGIQLHSGARTAASVALQEGDGDPDHPYKPAIAQAGDIWCFTMDCDTGTLSLEINGSDHGVVFNNLPKNTELFPAVSLKSFSDCVCFVTGDEKGGTAGAEAGNEKDLAALAIENLVSIKRFVHSWVSCQEVDFGMVERAFSSWAPFVKNTVRQISLGTEGFQAVNVDPKACSAVGFYEGDVVQTEKGRAVVIGTSVEDIKGETCVWTWLDGEDKPISFTKDELKSSGNSRSDEKKDSADNQRGPALSTAEWSLSEFHQSVADRSHWTVSADAQLIRMANNMSFERRCHPSLLLACDFTDKIKRSKEYPLLGQIPLENVCARFILLVAFNSIVQETLPYIDLYKGGNVGGFPTAQRMLEATSAASTNDAANSDQADQKDSAAVTSSSSSSLSDSKTAAEGEEPPTEIPALLRRQSSTMATSSSFLSSGTLSLGQQLSIARNLIFTQVKMDLFREHTFISRSPANRNSYLELQWNTISVNRTAAKQMRKRRQISSKPISKRSAMNSTVMYQTYNQIAEHGHGQLRFQEAGNLDEGQQRTFKVQFTGEKGVDNGGPYRELFNEIVNDLESEEQTLFIPCPNKEIGGETPNQDKFIVDPANTEMELMRFVGHMLGVAIRGGIYLDLHLPNVLWKRMVGLPVSLNDYEAVDGNIIQLINMKNMIRETKDKALDDNILDMILSRIGIRNFTFKLSGGQKTVELCRRGLYKTITPENCFSWVRLAMKAKLQEGKEQTETMRQGLAEIVPADLFSLFGPTEFEDLICGRPTLDVNLLRHITVYEGGYKDEDPTIQYFWETVNEMSNEERTTLLRFMWARTRMPETTLEKFKITKMTKPSSLADDQWNVDQRLPHTSTCFFKLSLPEYTNKAALKKQLLYSMYNCPNMDLI